MKNLRLVELCSGIGAQAKGLEHTGLFQVESVATADLDKEVVVSYAAIHCGLTNELIESYENYPSKEEMAAELTAKRLGYDFKNDKPYDWYKLSRKKDKTKGIEKYWLADHLSHNLGDMMQIDALPDCDFLTYSCPCTDLSIAGHQEGLKWTCQDCGHTYDPAAYSVEERYLCPVCGSKHVKSTRSGLLYEVERLLVTAKQNGSLPKYLLMENVDALVSKKYIDSFNNWLERLENLGYHSYYQVINAKNAGVPQNRKRIFVFSILKEIDTGKFTFPVPFDNGIRLKDVLEDTVAERYYLSDEKVASFLGNLIKTEDEDTVSIKQATKDGYIKCDLPGVADLSYPESTTRRGRVQENGTVSPTLTAAQTGICKLEKITTNKGEGSKIATYSLNGYPLHTDENGNIKTIVAMRGRNPENPSDRSPTILREAMFDNKKILFRLCWPEYYKEHYAIPKAMDIFNCTGELKGNLVRASAIKDFEDEPEQEKKILQNGKFSTAKKERKRVYNHGQEVDDIIYWSMKQILPLFEMKTKDLYLSLAKPREAGWSKYGFVKVIEARGCYPTPLDFYFLNSPMEYQVDHIDEYIEARNQAKLPHVKALDMMYEAYQQSLEHGRY